MPIDEEFSNEEIMHLHEILKFKMELNKETDRGCALMAAAFLDENLKDMLKAKFIDDTDSFKTLFTGTGGMATFSSRIELSYLLGYISPQVRSHLNIIRRIRNDFAHSMEIISFETESISNRCRNLKLDYHKYTNPRDIFTASAFSIAGSLKGERENSERPISKQDFFNNAEEYNKFMTEVGSKLKQKLIETYEPPL